jgi:PIN domain nuclease of toxin-antitoxin system
MKLLLDTHVIIWWADEYHKISDNAHKLLGNKHELYVSIVSAWEVAIKTSRNAVPDLKGGVKAFLSKISELPLVLLPISPRCLEIVETLPFIHRDPFDRMLVATAMAEGMTILTVDENIHKYDVSTVW